VLPLHRRRGAVAGRPRTVNYQRHQTPASVVQLAYAQDFLDRGPAPPDGDLFTDVGLPGAVATCTRGCFDEGVPRTIAGFISRLKPPWQVPDSPRGDRVPVSNDG
jgi:hypothetical protein